MADEHAFLAHRCGYAVHLAKQTGNQWVFYARQANVLSEWLYEELSDKEHEEFWKYYDNKQDQDPWVILHDGMGGGKGPRGFNVTWTTPSGLIFCDDDYVNKDRLGLGIFRVIFLKP